MDQLKKGTSEEVPFLFIVFHKLSMYAHKQ